MKSMTAALCATLLFLAVPAAADWNDPNVEGTQEYRLFKLYPQASVRTYEVKDFDSEKMMVGYKAGEDPPAQYDDIEGKVIHYQFQHKPTTSTLEILRNYQTVLQGKGFQTVVAGRGSQLPGLDVRDEDVVGYWRWEEPGKGMIWVALSASYESGHVADSTLTIVETKPMQQGLEAGSGAEPAPTTATSMADVLQETGRVAVYGITFDFNKATIRPESAPVLGQVLALLQGDVKLALAIEGHTDSIGTAVYNQKLSADRAVAVKTWLVTHGIEAARLATAGFGDTKPVADNAAEEGRAKNRRVELVRQ